MLINAQMMNTDKLWNVWC